MAKLLAETWILGTLGTLDAATTAFWIKMGWVMETNPILAFYLGFGLLAFLLVKLLLVFGPLYVLEYLRHRYPQVNIRRWIRIGMWSYLAVYGAGVALVHLFPLGL